MTALSLIREAYPVKKGDTVLVHAAAGGVGLLLCQLLRMVGAFTIGTAGSKEKCRLAEEHGADKTINYNEDKEWPETVKKLTGGKGVDVVYDSVGQTTWEGSLEAVKRKGKGMSSFILCLVKEVLIGLQLFILGTHRVLCRRCKSRGSRRRIFR